MLNAQSDILPNSKVILKPCGFSYIIFALKLAKRISLGLSPKKTGDGSVKTGDGSVSWKTGGG